MPAKKISEPKVTDVPEVDEEDAAIAALQAQLAAPSVLPARAPGRPVPEEKLTPKQKQIREMQDALAKKAAAELEAAPETLADTEGESIRIHVVEDGFTAQGRVWYRGQELVFPIGSEVHEQTKDRLGQTWLDLDDSAQARRFGRVMFRKGPWPFDVPEDWAQAEAKRNGAVPVIY